MYDLKLMQTARYVDIPQGTSHNIYNTSVSNQFYPGPQGSGLFTLIDDWDNLNARADYTVACEDLRITYDMATLVRHPYDILLYLAWWMRIPRLHTRSFCVSTQKL